MSGKTNTGTRTKVCSYQLSYLGKLTTQKLRFQPWPFARTSKGLVGSGAVELHC